jgi:hypothetical protein
MYNLLKNFNLVWFSFNGSVLDINGILECISDFFKDTYKHPKQLKLNLKYLFFHIKSILRMNYRRIRRFIIFGKKDKYNYIHFFIEEVKQIYKGDISTK